MLHCLSSGSSHDHIDRDACRAVACRHSRPDPHGILQHRLNIVRGRRFHDLGIERVVENGPVRRRYEIVAPFELHGPTGPERPDGLNAFISKFRELRGVTGFAVHQRPTQMPAFTQQAVRSDFAIG